ncbi:MAG: hypothetical protein JNL11_08700 [Bdellovibrionaceae bacterium]|nr:hypothetical protein [Pseudobdellovibrionaceae bacterium]
MDTWFQNMKAKLSQQLNSNSQVKKMIADLNKLNKEFQSKKSQINSFLNVEKDKTVKHAQTKYHNVMKQINLTQKQLDKDVRKTVSQIKKSAWQLEKNLESYKDKLIEQRAKVEKKFSMLNKTTKKKTTPKTTKNKTRRTTKKSV